MLSAVIRHIVIDQSKNSSFLCHAAKRLSSAVNQTASTSAATVSVDKQKLSELRKTTGFGFSNCRAALLRFENDITAAKKWLKSESVSKGWSKATGLSNRPMSSGLISVCYANSSSNATKVASLLELNCETDFVSKNEKFRHLVCAATQTAANQMLLRICSDYVAATTNHGDAQSQKAAAGQISLAGQQLEADAPHLKEEIVRTIGLVGENMRVRRASGLAARDSKEHFAHYVHSLGHSTTNQNGDDATTTAATNQSIRVAALGQHAAIVRYRRADDDVTRGEDERDDSESSLQVVATRIAQHIVGMKPTSIGSAEQQQESGEIESTNQENAGEREEAEREEALQPDGESADEHTRSQQEKEEQERRLLRQVYLFDENRRVAEVLREARIEITGFERFTCGEALQEDTQAE